MFDKSRPGDQGGGIDDIKVTNKEMQQIAKCMEQKEFRDLFGEYMEEISEPKNKAVWIVSNV